MAKKKKTEKPVEKMDQNTHILGAGEVLRQNITDTLETNYMPYAMSVILSRAIPEIDGFKPSHRKLLYTMYKMGLINGARTKSANIVGQTMKLNPHGDAAIYDTMVRLSRGYEALLHPFVDSKGNFGKAYSRDMQWAAPTTGIAVGMASSICPFNLRELCETTIALIKDPEADISETLKAPDFAGGGLLLYDRDVIDTIYKTGRGGFKIRAKYNYDKDGKCIDITEIPPTTTAEAIIDKVIEKFKSGSLREISDIRDETDKSGLKITIDLKKGTDPDKLMQKLYKATPLEDTFSCNFNVLIAGAPRVMGVGEILNEWIAFRTECVKRRVYFDLSKAKDKLHLLEGLQKILLDIDKAIKIIRSTEEESEVVPNLMIGFGIDEIQANYVAEIKLRHLNREYILKRTQDIEQLRADIEKMEDILAHKSKIKKILVNELTDVVNKYGQDRKTRIIFASEVAEEETEEEIPDFPVNLFFSKEGYFKKITPQALRMSGEQKLKEGDEMLLEIEATNNTDLLFFTDHCQVYKAKAADFDLGKASQLGDFVANKLQMDSGENAIYMVSTLDYKGYVMFFFENGKVAKVDLASYQTKTNRKKLIKAYSNKSPIAAIRKIEEDCDLVIESTAGKLLLFNTGAIVPKTTKDTQGVAVMTLKKGHVVKLVRDYRKGEFAKPYRYKTKNLPASGATLSAEDAGEQLSLI